MLRWNTCGKRAPPVLRHRILPDSAWSPINLTVPPGASHTTHRFFHRQARHNEKKIQENNTFLPPPHARILATSFERTRPSSSSSSSSVFIQTTAPHHGNSGCYSFHPFDIRQTLNRATYVYVVQTVHKTS